MSARNQQNRVAAVVVNYNTAEALAQLMFSLFRILPRHQLDRIVIVDNGSADGSVRLIEALLEAGLVQAILNRSQHYHGPALNQALDLLSARRRLTADDNDLIDYAWILDSDTVVLRGDVVDDALQAMRETGAALLGQFQYDALPEGYAHPSALFVDLSRTFLAGRGRFDNSGAPALELHRALRAEGIPIADFPLFREHYVLHVGRGTRRELQQRGETGNRHFSETAAEVQPHYHGTRHGADLHGQFGALFEAEVGPFSPQSLSAACLAEEQLELSLPEPTAPLRA